MRRSGSDRRQLLSEQAYRAIKRDIVRCRIPPGVRITESELCERYGFGRAAVRSSLSQLSNEKLVTPVPQVGYLVRSVTLRDVHEMFDARTVVEQFTVARACVERSDEDLETLFDLAAVECRMGDRASVERYLSTNATFHRSIAKAAGNRYLCDLLDRLMDTMQIAMYLGHMVIEGAPIENDGRHLDIVRCIEAGDGAEARSIMEAHLHSARHRTVLALIDSPTIQGVNLA